MRTLFEAVADAVDDAARGGEVLAAQFEGEASDFVRLNHARLRQAGRVERAVVRLRLIDGDRQVGLSFTLPGLEADRDTVHDRVREAADRLRSAVADAERDPLLDLNHEVSVLVDEGPDPPFDRDAFVDTVVGAAGDADLVGFCAAGPVAHGLCTSLGTRLWYRRSSVAFDWSVHLPTDEGARKAVKAGWSGETFEATAVAAAIARSRADAAVLARPVRRLSPGDYRVLLAPRAFADLLEMLCWGGFSARARLSGQSPFARLARGDARLSPALTLDEDLSAGFAPPFQGDGYLRPRHLRLIDAGRLAGELVSPRVAREFGLASTAASDSESPDSLRVAPGTLADDDALAALGTGVSVSNLWYLNWSDRAAGRVTGMTRFASVWVEDGVPVQPIEAMRFDDTVYRMLGEHLEALGATPRRMPATDTYDFRAAGGVEAPSALVSAMRFAL